MLDLIGELADPATVGWLGLVAMVAGVVRGLSGFGSAMIFVPVASALTSPPTAVVLLFVTDTLLTLPLVVRATRHCVWPQVVPLVVGAAGTAPLGVWLLVIVDPTAMRWIISSLILALVAVLASGWRWRRAPNRPATVAVGAASGLTGGMTGLGGPPVILFWMAGEDAPATVRANILVFLTFTGAFSLVGYAVAGLITSERVALGLALTPAYGLALLLGALLFRFATPAFFRGLAFGLCALAAVSGMPLIDGVI